MEGRLSGPILFGLCGGCFRRLQKQYLPPATLALRCGQEAKIGTAAGPAALQYASTFRVRRSGGTGVRLRWGPSPSTSTVRRTVPLDWAVAGAVGPRHPTLFSIRLHAICWRKVTTSKQYRGWEGRRREAIMEIPTEAHQNEAATRVFNFEQTARVLTC